MNKTKEIIKTLAAAVAVVAFLFSVINDYNRGKQSETRSWQKAIVFDIVIASDEQPVAFESIRDKYLNEVQAYSEYNVPRQELKKIPTRRILMDLIRDGVLTQEGADLYTIASRPTLSVAGQGDGRLVETLGLLREQMELLREQLRTRTDDPALEPYFAVFRDQVRATELIDQLVSILSVNGGKYDRRALAGVLSEEADVKMSVAVGVVAKAISSGLVAFHHQSGLTYLITDIPLMPFPMGPQ